MSDKTIVLHIPTMHCGSCEKKIRAKLEEFSLKEISADFTARELSLTFSADSIRALQLKQAVEASGFAVAKMETRENA